MDREPYFWFSASIMFFMFFALLSVDVAEHFMVTRYINIVQIPLHVPAALILAALCLHRSGYSINCTPLNFLGDISFSLYLSHAQVLDTLSVFWPRYPIMDPHIYPVGFLVPIDS